MASRTSPTPSHSPLPALAISQTSPHTSNPNAPLSHTPRSSTTTTSTVSEKSSFWSSGSDPRSRSCAGQRCVCQSEYIGARKLSSQVSVHTADVKNVLRAYSIDVSASSAADLKQVCHLCHRNLEPAVTHRTTSSLVFGGLVVPTTTDQSLTNLIPAFAQTICQAVTQIFWTQCALLISLQHYCSACMLSCS